jgi:hypothetical protein
MMNGAGALRLCVIGVFACAVVCAALGEPPSQGASPSYLELRPPAKAGEDWSFWVWSGNDKTAAVQSKDAFVKVSPDRKRIAYCQAIEPGYYQALIGQLTSGTTFRFDADADREMTNKILAVALPAHGYATIDCQQFSLQPDHWEDSKTIVIRLLARLAGKDGSLEELYGWTGLYDVEKQVVESVWYPGSLRTFVAENDQIWLETRSSGSGETTFWTWPGNRKQQAEQQDTSEFSVSRDRSWVVQQGNLSDGPYLNLYQRQKGGDYLLTQTTANSGSILEKVSAAASAAHDLGTIEYGNIIFEGWEAGTNQMKVGFSVKLDERGEHGVFLRLGWEGIYDLDQKRVTKQMDPGSLFEPIQ